MDVHLLVYDLSGGLARQMSMGLLGFQLDAIYHTSILLNGREYVYDGGIIAIEPESSHLGKAMDKLRLGTTHLQMDVIQEYLESLRPIFTVEAYDLFRHNCNNFTDSFANFLVGTGIPSHIANMPKAVLESPIGRSLLPQLTQGVNAGRSNGSILGLQQSARPAPQADVTMIFTPSELSALLDSTKALPAVLFFTSATCPPCKMMYPVFDQLASEYRSKVTFIKIDIDQSSTAAIAQTYSIRATPSFVTLLRGAEENRWTGADAVALRGNIKLLAQMAQPSHLHDRLNLPHFIGSDPEPVLYSRVPPLTKLDVKMGDETAGQPQVKRLKQFLEARVNLGAQDALLPDMVDLSQFLRDATITIPPDTLFAVVDLFRCALVDPRLSAYYAEESDHQTISAILKLVNSLDSCPYPLRLVTLQTMCNMFSSPLFAREVLRNAALRTALVHLISSSFLDDAHNNVRVASSSLLFNIALANRKARLAASQESLREEDEVELAASLVEAISQEEKSVEALQGMLHALGHLFYGSRLDGELADLLRALDAQGTINGKRKQFPKERLIAEVADELLGKGLRKP